MRLFDGCEEELGTAKINLLEKVGSEPRYRGVERRYLVQSRALAMLRKKTKEGRTDKHRNVARKLVAGRRLGAENKLSDVGWSNESKCPSMLTKKKALKSTGCSTAQNVEVK